MTDLGKVDRAFFDRYIYPNLGADRSDVALGPQHGVDFGVVEVGERAVVMASDPLSLVPALGFEKAGWFAVHVALSDAAVSGIPPSHLSVTFTLPPEMTDEEFGAVWEAFDREAGELGVSIVTGHTARYGGCRYPWVGGATTLAVGDPDEVVRPDGASPGDRLLVTKGPAVEVAGFLVTLFEDAVDLPDATIAEAKERFWDMSPVRDALTAAAAGPVTAMHDATEGGLRGALVEMAEAGGVRLDVDSSAMPVLPGVAESCDFFGIDPWAATSEGTLLLTVESGGVESVLSALDAEGIPAAEIGEVREGDGVFVDGDRAEKPESDPSWEVFEEYAEKAGLE
ncbi:AIR synthase family protein [Halorussus gelatinilyticus]|uniref:AIR synthase family protein n=1 Tax=Halorussus gelatinilyticus TaxID=2937524 RepID=A0A8U0IDK0_9EURY|nr:AIR synthase family protein [Halorussus gelatinilyticus]UPV98844.1 AIR synthase family protein [Halorussus gelatinilyticus]